MKKGIHPECHKITIRCVCGNSFETISTLNKIDTDICSACHPFFTGAQKFVDTAGRIEKFQRRYAPQTKIAKKTASEVTEKTAKEAMPSKEIKTTTTTKKTKKTK